MKFPWSQREEAKPQVEQDQSTPSAPLVQRHRSPGLLEVLSALRSDGQGSVLDLGPAVTENLAFFSDKAARLQIVDGLRRKEDGRCLDQVANALRELLPADDSTFDLVLAWGVLDYLSVERVAVVVDLLARLCRPDARLHLMVSGSGTMPASPTRFRIVDGENLGYEDTTREVVGVPARTPGIVEKMLEGFRIEHCFVLRHGYHEYVAAREA